MLVDWWIMFGVVMASFLLTPVIRHYAFRRNLLDKPNARSSHELPTPRGGGLAIVLSFYAGLGVMAKLSVLSLPVLLALMGAGILVAAIGFADDHRDVPARWRIVIHFIAAVWVVVSLNGFFTYGNISIIAVVLNLFWLVSIIWLINLYNFMDGIDALACAEAIFVGIGAALFFLLSGSFVMASIAAMLSAAVGGFLFWNLPPARIFMGDVGSGFIGIIIGFIALAGISSGAVNVWVWLILLGAFLVDATMTVARRILMGSSWYAAHRSHAYQHAARRLRSHGRVTAVVTGINVLWLLPWAVAAYRWPDFGIVFMGVAYFPLVWLALRLHAGRDEKKALPAGAAIC